MSNKVSVVELFWLFMQIYLEQSNYLDYRILSCHLEGAKNVKFENNYRIATLHLEPT